MDLIELAERQYARIAPKPGADRMGVPRRSVSVWLKDYVCPVIEDYVADARFRAFARWPLDVLAGAPFSQVARLVGDVNRCLVAAASALLAAAETKVIAKKIHDGNSPTRRIVEEKLLISAERIQRLHARAEEVDDLPIKLAQVKRIAQHRFSNLVCCDDYFGPVGSIIPPEERAEIRNQPGRPISEGELIVSLTPELHLVGDFVTRSMFRRIDTWMNCLREYRRVVHEAVRKVRRPAKSALEVEAQTWANLVAAEAALRKACLIGESAKLRDACMILTQIYAAFHPSPQLAWLGLPERIVTHGTSMIQFAIGHRRSLEALDQIAAALHVLRNWQATTGNRLDACIQTGGLVLVRQAPAVYWNKLEIDAPWEANAKAFSLLWRLAEKAKQCQGFVQDKDIWDKPGAKNRLSMLKYRLLELLRHTALSGKVMTARTRGVCLKLDGAQIHLLEAATV